MLNLDGSHSNQDAEVIKAVFSPEVVLPAPVPTDRWSMFRHACALNRSTARDFLLRRIAARQGGGDTLYGVDAARVLTALKPVRKTCRLQVEFPGERTQLDENARLVRDFVTEISPGRTDAAVKDRREKLAAWAKTTHERLGPAFEKKAFADECLGLFAAERPGRPQPDWASGSSARPGFG